MRQVMLVSFLLCSPHLFAADVVVNFKANLLAMTCTVNIVVGSGKAVNQTIDFGVLTRAELEAQGANTLKDFSLQYSNCTIGSSTNQTVTWMKTGIKASSVYSGYPTELKGGDNGAAAVLYRSGSPNSLLVLNSSTPLDWTSTERTNKALNLVLSLRPTSYATSATSGTFNGSLTFTTTYQ